MKCQCCISYDLFRGKFDDHWTCNGELLCVPESRTDLGLDTFFVSFRVRLHLLTNSASVSDFESSGKLGRTGCFFPLWNDVSLILL